ncbi:MAG: polysaccharide biosynthesis protein [Terriglobales bacterium]
MGEDRFPASFSPNAALGRFIDRLPRWVFTRGLQLAIDTVVAAVAIRIAFEIRFDWNIPVSHQPILWAWTLLVPLIRPITIRYFGGHLVVWRYFGMHDALTLVTAALPCTVLMGLLRLSFASRLWWAQVPIGVILVEFGTFLALAGGVRAFRRFTYEASGSREKRRRTLLLGSEPSLATAVRQVSSFSGIHVVGLLATEERILGLLIGGFPVIGSPSDLPRLLAAHAIDLVLISDASLDCLGSAISSATEFGVEVHLLPSTSNVMRGEVRISALADPARVLDKALPESQPHELVVDAFRDRVVLVTGAGGSIGSEICRQVKRLPVRQLVMLERDENSVFELGAQLQGSASGAEIVPVLEDIQDKNRIRRVFQTYRPHVVLHAAAYKHVPVMEKNCSQAILNNVIGTRELLEASIEFESERFLMISTDKAVRPSSVMGASKRVAEMVVQRWAADPHRSVTTRCACVRFGNVLGSRGSVVPIFLRQIEAGGPVTITDEDMTRYFMTIPEAVQLVLQAASLGSDGSVYMLDMGDPVRIIDLARKLIEFSGLRPGKDIEIQCVGRRPGEKISEQLWSVDAKVTATDFPRVMKVHPDAVPADFPAMLETLEMIARANDDAGVVEYLGKLPIEFSGDLIKKVASGF